MKNGVPEVWSAAPPNVSLMKRESTKLSLGGYLMLLSVAVVAAVVLLEKLN